MSWLDNFISDHPVAYSIALPDPAGKRETKEVSAIHPHHIFETSFMEFFNDLNDMVMTTGRKDDAAYLFPYTFRTDASAEKTLWHGVECIRKRHANIDKCWMVVADFDDGLSIAHARQIYDGFSYILHTSFSHRSPDSKGKIGERFRMFFPMKRPMTVEEFSNRSDAIFGEFLKGVDASNKSRGRGYCAPVKRLGYEQHFIIEMSNGKVVDFLDMPINAVQAVVPSKAFNGPVVPASNSERDQLLAALAEVVPNSDYDQWWRTMGSMAAAEFPIQDAMALSDGSPKTNALIESIYSSRGAEERAVGSLVALIREMGNPDCKLSRVNKVVNAAEKLIKSTNDESDDSEASIDFSLAMEYLGDRSVPVYRSISKGIIRNAQSLVSIKKTIASLGDHPRLALKVKRLQADVSRYEKLIQNGLDQLDKVKTK